MTNTKKTLDEILSSNIDKMNLSKFPIDFDPYTNWYMVKPKKEIKKFNPNSLIAQL